MACNNSCKLCSRLVFIDTVAFTGGNLVLTLPDTTSYDKGDHYCFVITTTLPAETVLNAPVVAVVGAGTTQFPVLCRCGNQIVAQQLNVRRRYPFRVNTTPTTGSLTILSALPTVETTTLAALNDAPEGGTTT